MSTTNNRLARCIDPSRRSFGETLDLFFRQRNEQRYFLQLLRNGVDVFDERRLFLFLGYVDRPRRVGKLYLLPAEHIPDPLSDQSVRVRVL